MNKLRVRPAFTGKLPGDVSEFRDKGLQALPALQASLSLVFMYLIGATGQVTEWLVLCGKFIKAEGVFTGFENTEKLPYFLSKSIWGGQDDQENKIFRLWKYR